MPYCMNPFLAPIEGLFFLLQVLGRPSFTFTRTEAGSSSPICMSIVTASRKGSVLPLADSPVSKPQLSMSICWINELIFDAKAQWMFFLLCTPLPSWDHLQSQSKTFSDEVSMTLSASCPHPTPVLPPQSDLQTPSHVLSLQPYHLQLFLCWLFLPSTFTHSRQAVILRHTNPGKLFEVLPLRTLHPRCPTSTCPWNHLGLCFLWNFCYFCVYLLT